MNAELIQSTKGWPIVWLFLLGATFGTALDAFHVYSKVERYPLPALLGVAWWVPWIFGAAAAAIGYFYLLMDPLLDSRRTPRRLLRSVSELMWLVLAYLAAASRLDAIAKVVLLSVIYLLFWLLAGRSWQKLLLSLVTALIGTLIEITLVSAGAFFYLHPDMLGVPHWLPCTYACASLAVGDLGRALMNTSSKETYEAT